MGFQNLICSFLTFSLVTLYVCTGQNAYVREPWLPASCPDKTVQFFRDYGYINRDPHEKNMTLEDIETALRIFQGFNHINVTSVCDEDTVRLMNARRCGCPDVVKGDEDFEVQQEDLQGPAQYRIGNTKWADNTLTWKISENGRNNLHLPRQSVINCMAKAFQYWADVTPLTFVFKTSPSDTTDIDIKFVSRRHQTRPPFYDFDGPGGVLAHAFFPQSGVVHFDDDEQYVIDAGSSSAGTDLCIVAAHEFGHTLGISHSNIQSALMAPYYRYDANLQLDRDDIEAVQAIYGQKSRGGNPQPQPTPPQTTPRPTLRPKPEYCGLKVEASFKMGRTTYIFTFEKVFSRYYRTYVYKVNDFTGLDPDSKTPIYRLFRSDGRYRWRAYPRTVDAAAYIPDKGYVFLFSGTRVFRYTYRGDHFALDQGDQRGNTYPRWMNADEFPEPPQAALELPVRDGRYFLMIFGKTMVWDWHYESRPKEKVGGWAYPMDVFGRRMPKSFDSAMLYDSGMAYLFQNDKYYEFSVQEKRVIGDESIKDIGQFFKGQCI